MLYITSFTLLLGFFLVDRYKIAPTFGRILLIATLFRLIATLLFISAHSYDTDSYNLIGLLTQQGTSIYPHQAVFHHPYLPFFLYFEALAFSLKNFFVSMGLLKIFLSLFDIGIMFLVYKLSKKNLRQTLLYAMNPISILVINVHGQFDVIPLFFLLWATYFLVNKKDIASVSALSVAVLSKTWPLLFVIPFFKAYKSKLLIVAVMIFPAVALLLYSSLFHTSIWNIIEPVKNYRGVAGVWGLGYLLKQFMPHLDDSVLQLLRRIFFIGLIVFSTLRKEKTILEQLFVSMLFFFTFTLTFGSHWVIWLVPFVILIKPYLWKWYISIATFYLMTAFSPDLSHLFVFHHYQQTIVFVGIGTWIVIAIMLFLQIFRPVKK